MCRWLVDGEMQASRGRGLLSVGAERARGEGGRAVRSSSNHSKTRRPPGPGASNPMMAASDMDQLVLVPATRSDRIDVRGERGDTGLTCAQKHLG